VTSVGELRVVPLTEWDDTITRIGGLDTYTSAAYHRASAQLEPAGALPTLLVHAGFEGEAALPLLLRPLPGGQGWDAVSAYGYGGPVAAADHDVAAFGAALDAWARENRVVATFLRLHPLLGNARLVPPTAELVEVGCTVAWDVRPGRDLQQFMHPHHRRAARRADRAGLDVTVHPGSPPLQEFRRLYEITMRRQQATPFYFFPEAYWDVLRTEGDRLGTVLIEGRLRGELVAALLCFVHGPWLHYHLGASGDAARGIGASNRCFLAAAEWAQSRGMTRFHLGGGVGGDSDSPLFTFKRRYDTVSTPLPFSVAKFVHDWDRYRRLAGTESTAGYFPPWRRTVPTA
jgi:hypothetical protein